MSKTYKKAWNEKNKTLKEYGRSVKIPEGSFTYAFYKPSNQVRTQPAMVDLTNWVPDMRVIEGKRYKLDEGALFEVPDGEKEYDFKAAWSGVLKIFGPGKYDYRIERDARCTCGAWKVKDPFHYDWCDLETMNV